MAKRLPTVSGRLSRFFRAEAQKIAREIAGSYALDDIAKTTRGERILNDLKLDNWTAVKKAVEADLATVFLDSGKSALVDLAVDDFGAIFNLLEPLSKEFAETRSAELVTRVTKTTRERIRSLVERAITDGLTPAELSEAIVKDIAFSKTRAQLIARTELAFANVQGNLGAWEESGVVAKKQVLLGSEHDVDDECDEAADDGSIGIGESFSNGFDAPPFHPACVCDVIAITDENE